MICNVQSNTKKCNGETAQWKLTTCKLRLSPKLASRASLQWHVQHPFGKGCFCSDQEWLKKLHESKTCWRSTPITLGLQMCKAHKGTTCSRCTTAINQKHLRVVGEIKVTELTSSPTSVLCVVMFSRVFWCLLYVLVCVLCFESKRFRPWISYITSLDWASKTSP